ncbi:MAG: DUF4249 family protein [Candidatus Heimdallarchaeota archaeon]|nr:DUF4249 family protein [Candidatus Heimdallarchaeota archaeon]MCK5050026.1 DUF4249 family protein [Candidatus Heimdallarchaeota archaeon]
MRFNFITKKALSLIILVAALFSSCSTEIEINAPNLDVPIVYCLLDTESSVQYLKLNKTYLISAAALDNPPEADSQYFEGNIQIVLERWENNRPVEFIDFEPTLEVPKNPGFFPSDKNLLYKADTDIDPNSLYQLSIYLEDREKIIYAKTETIGGLLVVDPMDLEVRKISLNQGVNYSSQWRQVENAGIYQVIIRFNYAETKDGVKTEKYLDWPQTFTNPLSNVDYLTKDISGTRFFYVLEEGIEEDESVVREALSIDFYVLSGGTEIKFYIESTAPSEGALMERPVYTNITNGLGVFSSMATQIVKGLNIASTTIDSIAYGVHTKQLMFLDHNGERN